MNELKIFENSEFGRIRTYREVNGNITFCGTDAAKALGYSNTNDALIRHCKKDGVAFHEVIDSLGRTQEAKFITKGNLCRLVANSQLPGAESFEGWIFDEVVPTILEHGAYATDEVIDRVLEDPDFGIRLLSELKEERQKRKALEAKTEADRPKVLFAEAVETAHTSILIGDLAKLIKQNGVNIGQNRLYAWLRDNGFLIKTGESYNMPTQRAMEMKLFEVKERTLINPDGSIRITRTTKVTGKGQQYFVNKFLAGRKIILEDAE